MDAFRNRLPVLCLTLIVWMPLAEIALAQSGSGRRLWENYRGKEASTSGDPAVAGPPGSGYGMEPADESTNKVRVAGNAPSITPLLPSLPREKQEPGELFQSGRVLAIVGGEPILEGDLLLTINEIIQTKAADAPDYVKEKMREQGIRELLPRAIERKMFYHEAVQMLPDPSKVQDIKKDLYSQLDEKQLPMMLKKYQATNLTELDGRLRMLGSSWRAVKEQAAEQEIAKFAITSKINISPEIAHDELYLEYQKRREQYHLENQVRWEHLMVSFSKYPDRREAKRRLAEMGNQIVYGADFAETAKKGSDGFFASKGGQYDWTKRGSLTNQILEEKIFTSPVNELSDIFESPDGYHIIRVKERQQEGYVPFAEVQDELRQAILDARQSAAAEQLLKDIKKKVPYEILLDGIEF